MCIRDRNKVDSFEFPGLSGMDKMASIMSGLRENPPKDFGGDAVVKVVEDVYKRQVIRIQLAVPRKNGRVSGTAILI